MTLLRFLQKTHAKQYIMSSSITNPLKFAKRLAGLACFLGVFLGIAENQDGSCDLVWTISCLAVAIIGALVLRYLEVKQKK